MDAYTTLPLLGLLSEPIITQLLGPFDVFFNAFIEDVAGYYTPFMPHVLGYWERRHEENILFITYEEMKRDLPAVIRKVSGFLNKIFILLSDLNQYSYQKQN